MTVTETRPVHGGHRVDTLVPGTVPVAHLRSVADACDDLSDPITPTKETP